MNVDKVFDRKREIISMPVDKSYKSKNPLVRWYFTSIHRISVELAGLKGNEAILDFGCGSKELSKRLQNYKVYNYDINPDLTEVKDYKKLKPDVIFAISAFEHIPKNEIEDIINNFKKMNPNVNLIVALPKCGILNKIGSILTGTYKLNKLAHISYYKDINKLLMKQMNLIKKKNFIFMYEFSKWCFK